MSLFSRIIRESLGMLVLGSLISTIGGFGIESIRQQIFYLLPLLILMPALNDMTGDYGTIVAARFTTMLYTGKIKARQWWRSHELHRMFWEIVVISTLSAIYIAVLASIIARFRGFLMSWEFFQKTLFLALVTTWLLVTVLFVVCVMGGFFVYKKKHDPDNYLIPLATSLADLGSMLILTVLVRALF